MTETQAKRVFVLSLAFLLAATAFVYGLAIGHLEIWPYSLVRSIYVAGRSLVRFGAIIPENRRMPAPTYASRQTFTIYDSSKLLDGYYVFVGWDDEHGTYSAWLYDNVGHTLHRWDLAYSRLDVDGPLNGRDMPHGFNVLGDGSVVVNFDHGDVMARLDACSRPIWTKPGVYHHSIEVAEDGSLWAWRGEGTAYGHQQYMATLDPETGETLREISLLEDIVKPMGPSSIIFGVRPHFSFREFQRVPSGTRGSFDASGVDIFHPNDIDILSSGIADQFPLFDTGDLMISMRNVNLVAVIDPVNYRVKWWSSGPWILQHDPDFTADGKISVYDNNSNGGRSEILKIDPTTREISNDLSEGDAVFYSEVMGKHQYLPNGNVLIVIPGEGRVLEVTHNGRAVMEFNNLSTASLDYNEHVENGKWLSPDYFQAVPSCSN